MDEDGGGGRGMEVMEGEEGGGRGRQGRGMEVDRG